MAGPSFAPPPAGPGDPGYGYPSSEPEVVYVWPDNARIIALWLIVLGIWSIWGWIAMRGSSCWICGRDNGLCRHTRDKYDSGGTKR